MAILINSELGQVSVDNGVIASIAGAVANSCYGVVGMASKGTKDGIVNLLKPDNMAKGIRIGGKDGGIIVELHIVVEYGVNIKAISDSIIHNVKYKIEKHVGIKVEDVCVIVESVRVQE